MSEALGANFVKSLDELYKKQDSRNLFKILINIRKGVEWPKHQDQIKRLRTQGYLKQVIRTLQMRKKRIVDTALSILGNCFMDKDCARNAMAHNILTSLEQVLKRYPKDNNINGRIFRILGNMCLHRDQWATTIVQKKTEFVTYTVELLKAVTNQGLCEDTASEATVLMAFRLLRLLVNRQTADTLLNSGVLDATGGLLIRLTAEWEDCGDHEQIIQSILKVMHEYSRYECRDSLSKMENTERGESLTCLSKVLLLSPKRVVKTAMNLMKLSTLRSQIPITELFNKLTVVLSDLIYSDINENTFALIRCACFLLDATPNRHRDGAGSCVKALVDVLETFEEPSNVELEHCVLIVNTLAKCRFEDQLLKKQLKAHLVRAMVDKLKWVLDIRVETSTLHLTKHKLARKRGGSSIVSKMQEKKRRSCPCRSDSHFRMWSKYVKDGKYISQGRYERMMFTGTPPFLQIELRRDKSPSSCSSEDSDVALVSSPSASPSRSPFSPGRTEDRGETDSDDYSPVCSEADSAEFNLEDLPPSTLAAKERYGRVDESEEEEENVENVYAPEEHPVTENLKMTLIEEIEKLFSIHLDVEQMHPHLKISEELLLLLIRCAFNYKRSFEARTATIAVVNKAFRCLSLVVPLLETSLAERVFAMTQYQHNKWCIKCTEVKQFGQQMLDTFSKLAMSMKAVNSIAHWLKKGPEATKHLLIMSVPYVVTNKNSLFLFLIEAGGLDILMDTIENNTECRQRAISAVCLLASRRLHLSNPADIVPPKCPTRPSRLDSSDHLVTFKLDDGSSVQADRVLLAEKSDYFAGLLNGNFKESGENEVVLRDVQRNPLLCVLDLVGHPDPFDRLAQKSIPVPVLLDAVVLCDRFLLGEELVAITTYVEKHRLSPRTVATIYQWSIESNLNLLRIEAVAFALVHEFGAELRTATFNKLFELGFGRVLVDDIRELLRRFLVSAP